ncbi:hypothetical protein D3C77_428340 [compost metagenome]
MRAIVELQHLLAVVEASDHVVFAGVARRRFLHVPRARVEYGTAIAEGDGVVRATGKRLLLDQP